MFCYLLVVVGGDGGDVCMCTQAHPCHGMYVVVRGQPKSKVLSFLIILRTEFRWSGVCSKLLYPLSHFADLVFCFYFVICLFGGQGLTAQVSLELTLYRLEVQDSLKLMAILLP